MRSMAFKRAVFVTGLAFLLAVFLTFSPLTGASAEVQSLEGAKQGLQDIIDTQTGAVANAAKEALDKMLAFEKSLETLSTMGELSAEQEAVINDYIESVNNLVDQAKAAIARGDRTGAISILGGISQPALDGKKYADEAIAAWPAIFTTIRTDLESVTTTTTTTSTTTTTTCP